MWKVQFAFLLILVLEKAFGEPDTICFAQGECQNSILISESITVGENGCLKFCQNTEGCNWFTYNSKRTFCMAFATCPEVVADACPDCLSGQVECPLRDNQCWVKGLCKGTVLQEVDSSSSEECHNLCDTNEGCGWFSYDAQSSICYILEDCPVLDESCETCVSSSALCKAKTSYSKLLVACGYTDSRNMTVEIIDLEQSTSNCENLGDFPNDRYVMIGSLDFDDNPMLCAGYEFLDAKEDCLSWKDSSWQPTTPSLVGSRGYSAWSPSPFPKESHKLIVAGGISNKVELDTVEILTKDGWEEFLPSLPVSSSENCMVLLNSTTVILIGGSQDGHYYSRDTYLFNTASNHHEWVKGPRLQQNHEGHSCGRIRKDSSSNQFSVIVVGGYFASGFVEVLDEGATKWRYGPCPVYGNHYGALVEDSAGGVILVGGRTDYYAYLDTLYRLSHAGEGNEWIKLPQKLKDPRFFHTAFLVPDDVVSCSSD